MEMNPQSSLSPHRISVGHHWKLWRLSDAVG
jgi:hypothetical protein